MQFNDLDRRNQFSPRARAAAQAIRGYYRPDGSASPRPIAPRGSLELAPSFFIVGAPRCGTTSLSKALKSHPRISFSKPKETHFFLLADPDLSESEQRERYLSQHHPFLDAEHRAIGDGSVSYLYSPEAIRRALRFDPRAKFLVMVRSPLEMVPSYHARMVYDLQEDRVDLAQAWALQSNRAAGRDIPRGCLDARVLQYGEIGRLGAQVERLFEVAGRERCMVVVFEDFVRAPRETYAQVLKFIGVEDDGQKNFKAKAQHRDFKSRWLQQFVMNPPPWALRLIHLSDAAMIKRLKQWRRRLEEINTFRDQRPQLSNEMRATLRAYYADDVRRLSELLSRDLSHWLA